jgi:hypothetical protein
MIYCYKNFYLILNYTKKYYLNVLVLIIKLLNIENLLYDMFNDIFLTNVNSEIESNKDKVDDAYKLEVERNLLMIKLILGVSIIGYFNLSSEQIGGLFIAYLLSEIIDALTRK